MILLNLIQYPIGYLAVLGVFAAVAGVLAVMPIRGGTGQHAGAGPGAVMVWQLTEALEAERSAAVSIETADDPAPEEEIRWPEEPVAEYVGRHRLWWDIDEHPQLPVDVRLGCPPRRVVWDAWPGERACELPRVLGSS
ncbi:hypothetical protein [Saccharopolyspora elongata]|uniref:Uncharacterized protein n=1 Tax=Saccharopolyspora elongata TaxID=2530387 RepID=A0A4R4Z0J9_9PSEU|nr:hypothetical protein [Saccharopolyspora elongata]TDD51375.1 hypothetical protein E1288_14420 [Saccharopolyspora elongata]